MSKIDRTRIEILKCKKTKKTKFSRFVAKFRILRFHLKQKIFFFSLLHLNILMRTRPILDICQGRIAVDQKCMVFVNKIDDGLS